MFDFYAESSKSDASSSCGLSVLNDYTITQWNYVNRVLGEGTSGKDIDVTDEVIEVDISSLTGEYYICVNAGGNSQIRKSKVTVKQIYLERW